MNTTTPAKACRVKLKAVKGRSALAKESATANEINTYQKDDSMSKRIKAAAPYTVTELAEQADQFGLLPSDYIEILNDMFDDDWHLDPTSHKFTITIEPNGDVSVRPTTKD